MRYICTLPMMPIRSEAKHSSEMVSMLLFGESFKVIESKENWHYIICEYDAYEGWLSSRNLLPLNDEFWTKYDSEKPVYSSKKITTANINGNEMLLSPGSRLPLADENGFHIGTNHYSAEISNENNSSIEYTAKLYINTPYLWGGRSNLGIDCSGFTQMVFKLCGIQLPRDAWQQAEKGIIIDSLENSQCGDLAFFAEGGDKITHVGILLGENKIIHASERVRIDGIDENGIFNTDLEKYTLKPTLIKRYF